MIPPGPSSPSAALRFETVAVTHPGRVRRENEDAHLVREASGLWAVADGMGGHHAGQLASRTVIEALAGVDPQPSAARLLDECEARVVEANARLLAFSAARGRTVGTTLAVLLVHEARYACVWCGDSRIYRLRDGVLARQSRDHTQVQDLVDQGLLTAEEGRTSPFRNVITRAIGVAAEAELEIADGLIEGGDLFLLCSDGLTNHVTDAELAAGLGGAPLDDVCRALLDLALERGGTDNVTVMVMRVGAGGSARPAGRDGATVIP